MKSRGLYIVVSLAVVLLLEGVASAGLIYKKSKAEPAASSGYAEGAAPYGSVRAPKPPSPQMHDLIKIVVLEYTIAQAEAKTKIDKNTSLSASLDEFINFHGKNVISGGGLPSVKGSASHEVDNKAATSKKTKLSATIKAEVVEILPNGNLVIEAKKDRQINEEKETITLTGVIDPDDLDPTGSIISDDVAQLKVTYNGSGSVSDAQKRGLLSKILDVLWPF